MAQPQNQCFYACQNMCIFDQTACNQTCMQDPQCKSQCQTEFNGCNSACATQCAKQPSAPALKIQQAPKPGTPESAWLN